MSEIQLLTGLAIMAPPFILDYQEVTAVGECHWLTALALPVSILAMMCV